MANIYGFTLKNRKTFQGIDWQGKQGNLYYNGKKVAWYNDSGNGVGRAVSPKEISVDTN